MKSEDVIKYGILLPDGTLARLKVKYNGDDRYACGENSYKLTDDTDCKEWLVNDLKIISETLIENTPWYNTDDNLPGWGKFSRNELLPVKVKIIIEPVYVKIPVYIKTIDCYDISCDTAMEYSGLPLSARDTYVLVTTDVDYKELLNYIGETVYFGNRYCGRQLIAALPSPDFKEGKTILVCKRL